MTTDETLEVTWCRFTKSYYFNVSVGGISQEFDIAPDTYFATFLKDGKIECVRGPSVKYIDWSDDHLLFHGKTYSALP